MPVISYLPSAVFETSQDNCIQQLDDQTHNLRISRVTVSGPELSSMSNLSSEVQILPTFDFDGRWRTDAGLGRKLGLSRQQLGQLSSVGLLHFDPVMPELRTRLRDHTILTS
jgi:hypothetical protein